MKQSEKSELVIYHVSPSWWVCWRFRGIVSVSIFLCLTYISFAGFYQGTVGTTLKQGLLFHVQTKWLVYIGNQLTGCSMMENGFSESLMIESHFCAACFFKLFVRSHIKAYSEPCQTSKMELLRNYLTVESSKTFHLRYLTGFWIRLWFLGKVQVEQKFSL